MKKPPPAQPLNPKPETLTKNTIVQDDLDTIFKNFKDKKKLRGGTFLITGCAGFLGFYFLHFLCHHGQTLGIKKIIGLDNFKMGRPRWLDELCALFPDWLRVHSFDIARDDLTTVPACAQADVIIHMASIASPIFYRKFPLDTLDANIWGLRKLFDFYRDKNIKNFLFFSSSEIYGDPPAHAIPTPEDYSGNVSCVGPRACYDESKRFGETLCYIHAQQFNFPVTIVRPFNNYGPGMKLDDQRVPADFAKAILENKDIIILSNGSPTRTFCYVADALSGYLQALTYGKFDYFNIGIDQEEITIDKLAAVYLNQGRGVCGYTGVVRFEIPKEKEYLTHNPQRRAPDISKARRLLGYHPQIGIEEGVRRFLTFLKQQENRIQR